LEANNDVVGKTHDDHLTVGVPLPPLPCPQIEHVVQVDVCEQGRCATSL
jgi:hypothetical protein